MATICDIPPEIIQLITGYLDIKDLTRIWLAGNKRLNDLCGVFGGVSKVFAHFPVRKNHRQLPCILGNYKKLKYLDFSTGDHLCSLSRIYAHPPGQILPSSLIHLDLQFFEAEKWFLGPNIPKDEFGEILKDQHISKEHLYPSFANLKYLKLNGGPSSEAFSWSFPNLAPNLEHLHLCNSNGITNFRLKELPSNLKTLILQRNSTLNRGFIKLLPKSLTHLDLATQRFWNAQAAENNRKGNTDKDKRSSDDPDAVEMTDELKDLPPNLTKLALRWASNSSSSDLPRKITSLKLYEPIERASEFFMGLPQSLTELRFPPLYPAPIYANLASFLPKGLKILEEIEIYDVRHTDVAFWNYPAQSSSASAGPDQPICVQLTLLPQGLTTLSMFVKSSVNQEFFSHLPRTLKHLTLGGVGHFPNFSKGLAELPDTLVSFRLIHPNWYLFDEKAALHLPRTLQTLSINRLNIRSPTKFFANLPPCITHLTVPDTFPITADASVANLTQLEHLELPGILSIEKSFIQSFSRNLKTLILSQVERINDHIEYLPPSLTVLKISKATDLTEKSIEQLPRTLKELCMENSQSLSVGAYDLLPPSLTMLRASGPLALVWSCENIRRL